MSAPSDAASSLTAADLRARLLDSAEVGDNVERKLGESSGSLPLSVSIPDCDERARYEGRIPFNELMGSMERATAGYIHQRRILVQRIYSAEPATLASRVKALFTTLTACPQYTEVMTWKDAGTGAFKVTGQKVEVPGSTGQRYGYLETGSQEDSSPTTNKLVAVVLGRVAVILDGAPSLVDQALDRSEESDRLTAPEKSPAIPKGASGADHRRASKNEARSGAATVGVGRVQ